MDPTCVLLDDATTRAIRLSTVRSAYDDSCHKNASGTGGASDKYMIICDIHLGLVLGGREKITA